LSQVQCQTPSDRLSDCRRTNTRGINPVLRDCR